MKRNTEFRGICQLLAVFLCVVMALILVPMMTAEAGDGDPVYGQDRTEDTVPWQGSGAREYWDRNGNYLGKNISPECKHTGESHIWETDTRYADQERDCSHIGIAHQFCKICGITRTVYSKAKGHWHYTWKKPYAHKDATCEETGYDRYRCEDCGAVIEETIPALGHIWKIYNQKRPTSTENGCYTYECQRYVLDGTTGQTYRKCGAKFDDIIAMKGGYTIPQLQPRTGGNEYDDRQDELLSFYFRHKDTANGLRYSDLSTSDIPVFSSDGKTMTISSGPVKDKIGGQTVAVVYAESIAALSQDKAYIDVVIDCDWKLDVYLVDFGTRTQAMNGEPRKGLRNITVNGRCVNVYLINSNIGMIDYLNGEQYAYDTCDVKLTVSGFDSHIYMSGVTNSVRPKAVHCTASVDMPFYDDDNLLDGCLKLVYQPRNAQHPFVFENKNSLGTISSNYSHKPALEIANMTVDALGTPKNKNIQNGTFTGLSGAKLINCDWSLDTIELKDFSFLDLTGSTVEGAGGGALTINVHNRAELNLGGTMRGDINILGTNTIRLNDATLYGSILAEGTSDDGYEQLEQGPDAGMHVHSLGNGSRWAFSGAQLDMQLSGSNTILFNLDAGGNYYKPGIMVHNQAILIVKDDPKQEGVGSLKIACEAGDFPYGAASSISGAPAAENPRRHGYIFIESGILDLKGYNGGAALGGALPEAQTYRTFLGTVEPEASVAAGYNRVEHITEGSEPGYYGIKLTTGFCSSGGCISISGGVVTANAEYGAAAIGGARGGNAGPITIGGNTTVNAETSGGGAAIGGGLPVYEDQYVHVGYQLLRLMTDETEQAGMTGIFVYPDENGELRYLNDGWYADGAGLRHDCTAGELCEEKITQMIPDANSAIYKKMKKYVSGGGSGTLHIAGGCTVNAWADNPAYDESGRRYDVERNFYHPLVGGKNERESFNPGILYRYSEDYYNSHHRYYEDVTINGHSVFTSFFFNRDANDGMKVKLYQLAELSPDGYDNGRKLGYVIGSATETANLIQGNSFLMASAGAHTASIVMGQHAEVNGNMTDCSWNQYYKPSSNNEAKYYDFENEEWIYDGYVNSIVSEYDTFILNIGFNKTESNPSGAYEIRHNLYKRVYAVRGQIDLSLKGGTDNNNGKIAELNLPAGATLKVRSGAVLNVGVNVTINEHENDEGQFVVEDGAVVKGKGLWPRKPADPENPPSTEQIRSLLDRIKKQNEPDPTDPNATAPVVVTHLAVIQTSTGGRMILSGNSADEIHQQMAAVSLDEKYLLSMFSAGDSGFKKTSVTDSNGFETVTWELNSYTPDTIISLVENGALVATPGPYVLSKDHLNLILTEDVDKQTVQVILKSARLSTPEYGVFEGTADEELEINLAGPGSKTAFTITLDEDQIVNNKCICTVPKFAGSEFAIKSLSPLRNKCAMRFGGTMNFNTPITNIAGININTVQLNYDGGLALGGIDGGGYVSIPEIGGFPVSGSAKLELNTFAPNRKLSLEVELDTPIFSGAFRGAFKEARGNIWLDSLYAELSVDKGGIPLVPPTTIGYLQGGGLGFSGLADTIAMDSPGTIPLRFEIAAKASILDVVSGWARVSVGPSGFDLDLEDIKVADFPWIKKFGISASLVTGEKEISGIKYWGVDSDMSTYLVIAIPLHDIGYGNSINEDEVVAGLSASGKIGIGSFAGYKKMKLGKDTYVLFVYQLRASGSLSGSLTIPKGIVGGYLPTSTVNVGNIELGFYAEANATTKVNASEVDETKSPANLVRQLAKNADLEFKAAVGAKATAGVGKAKVFVRAVYVLGQKTIDIDYGFGEGKKLDLTGSVSRNYNGPRSYTSTLVGTRMEGSDEPVPTIVQTSAYSAAKLGSPKRDAADTVSLVWGENGSINATVNSAMAGNVIIALQLDRKVAGLSKSNVIVTNGSGTVSLIPDAYDENGESTVANANFCVGTTGTGSSEVSTICFVPYAAGTYNISLTGTEAQIAEGDAIITKNFATLDTTATSLGDSILSYQVNDAVEDAKYKVQVFMGEQAGKADFMLAETEELTAATLTGTLDVAFSGSLAPTGSYYPVVLLLEYVDAANAAGQAIGTWAVVDQINHTAARTYTNSDQINAPANITLSYDGNGCMSASWSVVPEADYYEVVAYREVPNTEWDTTTSSYVTVSGTHFEDTGLRFETTGTEILMDLSTLYGTPAENQSVKVGVQAVKNIPATIQNENGTTEEDTQSESQYKTGVMGYSDPATLSVATLPVITYSENVVGEGSSYTVASNVEGSTFTIKSASNLNYTVTNSATGMSIASADNKKSLEVKLPEPTNETLSAPMVLEVKAMNADGDYALHYITVNYDTVAPSLILNNLGRFPKWGFDAGYYAEITGHTEAMATVCLYSMAGDDLTFLTSVTPNENGSFTIPVQFTDVSTYCVQAVDAVGNKSVALTVDFPESDVVVNMDPNSGVCSISSIGLVNGSAIGSLPTPTIDDTNTAFSHWYLNVDTVTSENDGITGITTTQVPVTADMVFTMDEYGKITVTKPNPNNAEEPILVATYSNPPLVIAGWDASVVVSYSPGENAACDVGDIVLKTGSKLGTLPVPRRTDGANRIFLGWYSGSTQYTEDSVINSNTTLTAKWAIPVTVTFDPGLGNLNLNEAYAYAEDGSIVIPSGTALPELPEVTATGYTFDGWFNGDTAAKASDTYSSDTTLTAQWTRITAQVTVTQTGCVEGNPLPDPVVTWPNLPDGEEWIGDITVSYDGSNYIGTSKPTLPGTYEVIVYRETFGCAYYGSAKFTISPRETPCFATNRAMVLSDEIGVKFKVLYPEGFDMSNATVTYVTSDGRSGTATAETISGENAMWFNCDINALQLNDMITVTMEAGGKTFTAYYSSMQYIDTMKNSSDQTLVKLVEGLQDYGYYMQQSGWTDGNPHAPIEKVKTLTGSDIAAVLSDTEHVKAIEKTPGNGIENILFSLTLNAETKINIFVKPKSGVKITSTGYTLCEIDGETYYRFTSAPIGPLNLGEMQTFTIETSKGPATVKASAMSYVKSILEYNDASVISPEKKLAMIAYYNYYKAALAYKAAH